MYAMYYSISLFSTVAYGDIIPKNSYENVSKVVRICRCMLCFCCFWLLLALLSLFSR